ncbi:carbohydrate ABC transporter permease [Streptomyces sp. NPDC020917]|uniref:carbohydrate ABC transporter permease n=1 Tax=Streptomyces sp. NPDC020917 TaxID=3365102 RepID=UPI0037A746DB
MAVIEKVARSAGSRPQRTSRRSRDGRIALIYLAPGVLGLLVFVVLPLVGAFVVSFYDWGLTTGVHFTGLANYRKLFTKDVNFPVVLRNTLIFVVIYTPLNLLCALGMATWLNTRVYAKGLFRVLFFLPVITPSVANALVWRFMLQQDGLVNQVIRVFGGHGSDWLQGPTTAMVWVIVLSIWQSFGYNLIVLGAGLDAIEDNLYEAARIDGAGPLRRFFSVTLPMLSPALFFTSTMTLISAFQVFTQPQLLTGGGPGESTNTLVLYLYQNGFSFDRLGYASAIGWVLFAMIMIVTGVQFAGQRRWVHYV